MNMNKETGEDMIEIETLWTLNDFRNNKIS